MGLLLLIVLLVVLFGALPTFGYSRDWGYRPAGLVSLLLIGLVVLLVLGSIPWGFQRSVYVTNPPVVVIEPRPITVINPPAKVGTSVAPPIPSP